jgi:hypothetical protein
MKVIRIRRRRRAASRAVPNKNDLSFPGSGSKRTVLIDPGATSIELYSALQGLAFDVGNLLGRLDAVPDPVSGSGEDLL